MEWLHSAQQMAEAVTPFFYLYMNLYTYLNKYINIMNVNLQELNEETKSAIEEAKSHAASIRKGTKISETVDLSSVENMLKSCMDR